MLANIVFIIVFIYNKNINKNNNKDLKKIIFLFIIYISLYNNFFQFIKKSFPFKTIHKSQKIINLYMHFFLNIKKIFSPKIIKCTLLFYYFASLYILIIKNCNVLVFKGYKYKLFFLIINKYY